MTSIFENTHSKVTVHILHDDTLTDDNRRKFLRTAEKYSQGIEFHDVTEYRDRVDQDIQDLYMSGFTVGTLYKLAIHELLPLDKVIYLDGDIIVNLDIRDLWEIDTGDNCLAGAVDEVVVKEGRYPLSFWGILCRLNGYRSYSYINGGVLVMNLCEMRRQGCSFHNALERLKEYLPTFVCGDQDVFNSLFLGNIKLIDQRFNRQLWNANDNLSGSIIHTNHRKSWKVYPEMLADRLYWKMYLHSAWGEDITPGEFVDVIACIPKPKLLHHSPRQCFMRLLRTIWLRVSLFYVRRIVSLVVRSIYHRMKYRLTRS